MDNLPNLRDIHIPDGVSAFPPAYGWWVMLLALLLMGGVYQFIKIYSIRICSWGVWYHRLRVGSNVFC